MKVSEMITELIKIQADHGDIPVKYMNWEFVNHSDPEFTIENCWTVPDTWEDIPEKIVQIG